MRLRLAGVVAALLLIAGACETRVPAAPEELASDLRAYIAELKIWDPLEKDVFGALAEVDRTYYVDDDFVVRRFKGVLPQIRNHVEELRRYRPKTADLRAVHDRYREGWEDMDEAFNAVIGSVESKNYTQLASAKNRIEAARRKLLGAFADLDALLAEAEPELRRLRDPVPPGAAATTTEGGESGTAQKTP